MDQEIEGGPAALAEWVAGNIGPEQIKIAPLPRPGKDPAEVDAVMGRDENGDPILRQLDDKIGRMWPERRAGTATLQTLDSFIAHVMRFADGHTGLFLNAERGNSPVFQAVYDYHRPASWKVYRDAAKPDGLGMLPPVEPAGATTAAVDADPTYAAHETGARYMAHRAVYTAQLSDAWKAWAMIDGKWLGQKAFSELLEERVQDVLVPTTEGPDANVSEETNKLIALLGGRIGGPTQLVALARDFAVTENSKVRNATNLQTGEVKVQFEIDHNTPDGQPTSLTVPTAIIIGVPVFEAGQTYGMLCRLRYRINSGRVEWSILRHRADRIIKDAVDGAADNVASGTGLQVFLGTPEG